MKRCSGFQRLTESFGTVSLFTSHASRRLKSNSVPYSPAKLKQLQANKNQIFLELKSAAHPNFFFPPKQKSISHKTTCLGSSTALNYLISTDQKVLITNLQTVSAGFFIITFLNIIYLVLYFFLSFNGVRQMK